jgi:glycosyltransferase involved in cell wall biosynthesis
MTIRDLPAMTVVMAAHNASHTIERSLESLVTQDFALPFEIIVVDDGSNDDTAALVRQMSHSAIRLVSLPANVGRAAARNAGVKLARAPFVVVADADDISRPGRLASHWRILNSDDRISVTAGQIHAVRDSGADATPFVFPTSTQSVNAVFARGRMGLAHPASAFRRDWFDTLGGYDADVLWAEDYDLFLRGWGIGEFVPVDDVLIDYRRNERAVPWKYWWNNERHRRAINLRRAAGESERLSFDSYLRESSGPLALAKDAAKFSLHSARNSFQRLLVTVKATR